MSRRLIACFWSMPARSAVEAANALIAEVERTQTTPEPEAVKRHPGWVFVDRDKAVWGYQPLGSDCGCDHCGCGPHAEMPFNSKDEAQEAGKQCIYGCTEVREWRPTDRVPPMPKGE